MRTLLHESTLELTWCHQLVSGWPNFIGIKDALSHGVGGVILGKLSACPPTIFCFAWPDDIQESLVSPLNRDGTVPLSDLEMAGLRLLFVIMEQVCGSLVKKRTALFSDNSPTLSWVKRLASTCSRIAAHLIQVLALNLKIYKCCPITLFHIRGSKNMMTNIPLQSFGSVPQWYFKNDSDLLTFFNLLFPLPNQQSWMIFCPSYEIRMSVIFVLWSRHYSILADWWQLPSAGCHCGAIGRPTLNLWDWSLHYRMSHTLNETESSQDLPSMSAKDTTGMDPKSELIQYVQLTQPLARQLPWQTGTIPQNLKDLNNSSHDCNRF